MSPVDWNLPSKSKAFYLADESLSSPLTRQEVLWTGCLQLSLADLQNRLCMLDQALENQRFYVVEVLARKIKELSGLVRGLNLATIAGKLEKRAQSQNLIGAQSELLRLNWEYQKMSRAWQQFM